MAGIGHGHLWRASTFSGYRQQNGFCIFFEPIARRLGGKSVEGSLAELRLALMTELMTVDRPGPRCT